MLAALLALAPAQAAPAGTELTALAARYVPLIGRSQAELSAELGPGAARQADAFEATLEEAATLAGEPYDVALLYDGESLYGVRLARGGLDEQGAMDCARALADMARAAYGAPATYPVEDAGVREYWYFARPQNLALEIAATGSAESGYAAHVQFALSRLPGVEYALGDQVAPYMELLGEARADVCAALGLTAADGESTADGEVALEPVALLGAECDRALLFEGDALSGVAFAARGPQADIAGLARRLYAQAAQEYGVHSASSADAPFMQALEALEAGAELRVDWRLPVADGSLPGLSVELATGIDGEGDARVELTYALVDGA